MHAYTLMLVCSGFGVALPDSSLDAQRTSKVIRRSSSDSHLEKGQLATYAESLHRVRAAETIASNRSVYWRKRLQLPLYQRMVQLVRQYAPRALTVLDVGAYESPLVAQFDWIPTKVATDVQMRPQVWRHVPGIAFIVGDFMKLKFGTRFDLVICNQVIEHLQPDSFVERFVRKLAAEIEQTLIVSTTLEMAHGTIMGHVQDPISEAEFRGWFRNITAAGAQHKVALAAGELGTLRVEKTLHRKDTKNIIGIWTRGGKRPWR